MLACAKYSAIVFITFNASCITKLFSIATFKAECNTCYIQQKLEYFY